MLFDLGIPVGMPKGLSTSIIFMKTGVTKDSKTFWEPSDAMKGDYIELVPEMDCIVAISACPGLSSGSGAFPVGIEISEQD